MAERVALLRRAAQRPLPPPALPRYSAAFCVPRAFQSTAAATASAGVATGRDTSTASEKKAQHADLAAHKLLFRPRWRYMFLFRSKRLEDFLFCREAHAVSIAQTYRHHADDITVTLIPLRHFAHPDFFRQVDDLCCQHQSVLMEGRTPLTSAPHSTIVPPRARQMRVRPPGHEDDEGWEPREVEAFFQPFSWGVKDSPHLTIVHAADKYDYERLPLWCSLRFNFPIIGSLAREQHCANMLYPLRANGYKTFAIPWGAAHMPIFHEMLLDNGFEPVGMCALLVLSRIDGTVSEGEFNKMMRAQHARRRRINSLYVLAALSVLYFLYSCTRVEYTKGPSLD